MSETNDFGPHDCKKTYSVPYKHRTQVVSAILSILIACLPSESKELLHENGIFIAAPTSKPLLFNYASFCKVLSINEINRMVNDTFKNNPPFTLLSLKCRNHLKASINLI